ncbi:MAG: DEAD/DEAH box helicase, partial [Proteobacteria bacterium]|nr:DEAD/DEAH box helicase [Pseudomonadota bacterium]
MTLLEVNREIPLGKSLTLAGLPEGYDAVILGHLAGKAAGQGRALLHIAKDDARSAMLARGLRFFAPGVKVLQFPAWDCLPFDRAGPKADILSERIGVLSELAQGGGKFKTPLIILTTINGALQRVPPARWISGQALVIKEKSILPRDQLSTYLSEHGYLRVEAVAEPGDYAYRGGLVDLYPPHARAPYRIDMFGDEVESIRSFDPLTQRTTSHEKSLKLLPAREFGLDEASIERFRRGYLQTFGPPGDDDPLYFAISEGRPYPGADHWLSLFHERLETLFDYLPEALLTLDHQINEVVLQRLEDIGEYYRARKESAEVQNKWSTPYQPLPPEALYLTAREWENLREARAPVRLSPLKEPESAGVLALSAAPGRNFLAEREQRDANVFEALKSHLITLKKEGRKVLISAISDASAGRLATVLADHGIKGLTRVKTFAEMETTALGLTVLALDHGFVVDGFALITETDILGDRLPRRVWRKRRAENFLREASALSPGDLVVHVNHGIGRFSGLETVTAGGARHDCLKLLYAGDDRLYLPVENIEMLSRYGEESGDHLLDKLGGAAWQTRHARLKKRIREIAGKLIAMAAARSLRDGAVIQTPDGIYQEFCARFPYTETEDQMRSIEDVLEDLGSGKPMDRLICGDVGFGKTEVALRASFAAVMAGYQVAIVTPTTLLSRQHFNTFSERFKGLPVVIGELSRLVRPANAKRTKAALGKGLADIIIGTHALLARDISFKALGLLIIDEEQHFGVVHKERLKALKADVHVLTLSATPIPRTLQMALSGLKDMSLIATPPVDRLAVRTYVMPFDEVVVREALLREH